MSSKRQCERALDEHEEALSRRRNVVGLGIVPDESGAGSFRVAVYVSKKLPLSQLRSEDVIPESLQTRGRGKQAHSVKTRVIEQGEVVLEEAEGGGLRG